LGIDDCKFVIVITRHIDQLLRSLDNCKLQMLAGQQREELTLDSLWSSGRHECAFSTIDRLCVPAGEEVWGNCANFATTALIVAMQAGHCGTIVEDGPRHVVAVVDSWKFDSLVVEPLPVK
jgi:hypothetical protein